MALVKPVYFNSTEAINQEMNPLVDTAAFAQITLNGLSGVGINANGQSITGLPAPVNTSDAATKSYVDATAQGLNGKQSVVALAAGNITLSGAQTIDGVSVTTGQRVLATGQTSAVNNGIWICQSGNWTRPTDYATGASAAGDYVYVEYGTVNQASGWFCVTTANSAVIDTNATTWTQFSGAGEIVASSGLSKNGNTLAVALATSSGLQFTSGLLSTYLNTAGSLVADTNGLRLSILNANTLTATLSSTANGASVLGLPSLFTVAGTATSASVTAPALNTLTAGNASLADSVHSHQSVLSANATVGYHVCSVALAAGDPVAWSTTNNTLLRGDAAASASSRIIGIAAAAAAAGTTVAIVKQGIATGVYTGGTAGSPVFLNSGGGLSTTPVTAASTTVLRVGYLINATDVDVRPMFLGLRSA